MIVARDVAAGRRDSMGPGLALVALSVVEQQLHAVRAVPAEATVVEVTAGFGMSRRSVHTWVARYSSSAQASAEVRA